MHGIGDQSCIIVPTQTTITMELHYEACRPAVLVHCSLHSIAMYKCNFNIVCIGLLMYIMLTGWEVYMHDHMHSAKSMHSIMHEPTSLAQSCRQPCRQTASVLHLCERLYIWCYCYHTFSAATRTVPGRRD